ncbi:transposase family protein (plasmid) [Chamaesiphon minutus PCC 6605]|uniref:Transposase family protein n=1 Tax=Chamaesiphon minutus (strain ATCC 27169 / PCC 6605) TaxID=1173020 RepID=K9URU6_CHAP6|nr:transposase family protein [Chamaesiphon minutus PCC 6605]
MVCGKANFTNLSRYGEYSERTYRRHYQKSFDFIPFHAQTIAAAIEPSREQIAAIDCSFISKSGKQTWGVDNFYNGSISKSQKGLEISVISVVDVMAHQGYTLSVQQTAKTERQPIPSAQPTAKKKRKSKSKAKAKAKAKAKTEPVISERVKGYLEQLKTARAHFPTAVKYLTADSFYSKKSVVDGVVALDLHLVSKLRIDADLRYCYTGEQKPKGAPRKYDGKVDLSDLSRLELSGELADGTKMYSQVVWHVSLKRQIRIVYLVDQRNPDKQRVALLFSTDTTITPIRLYEYYKSRFQIEFIFRDAKQFTGLCDCQSRQQQSLDFHFNASLAALNIAKLEQQQTQSDTGEGSQRQSFSMATYKRLALNGHLLERFISMLGLDPTFIKSHPNYDLLLQYGSLAP